MTPLVRRLEANLRRLAVPAGPGLVAVSGGADSLALLDLLTRAGPGLGLELSVLHVDHGIATESAEVAEQVRGVAARYGLPCLVEPLRLGPGASETRARRERYTRFRQVLARQGCAVLFLAHHADDQAETVLMRLLRGSGPAGLAGIPERRGPFVRPLLRFRRSELEAHLAGLGLEPWNDPANRDLRHTRAWLRQVVMPMLAARVPDLVENLARSARLAGEQRRAWQSALKSVPGLDFQPERGGGSVAAVSLNGYSSALRRAILRALARRVGLRLGDQALARVEALVAGGHTGQALDLAARGRAELTFGRLRLFRRPVDPGPDPVTLVGQRGAVDFGSWRLTWAPDRAPARLDRVGATTWVSRGAPLVVRGWRAGDRIRPLGGRGSRLVVRCMQEEKVAKSRRPFWPVVEREGLVLWVPDVCRSDVGVPEPDGESLRIDACLV